MSKKVKCYGCGLEYGGEGWIEAIIPDNIWDIISPTGNQNGLLCINCISKECQKNNLKDVPVWLCGTEPLIAMTGDPEPSEIFKIIRERGENKI